MAFGVYISGTVTIGISRKIEYPSNKQEGSRGSIIRRDGNRHTAKKRMATDHVPLINKLIIYKASSEWRSENTCLSALPFPPQNPWINCSESCISGIYCA